MDFSSPETTSSSAATSPPLVTIPATTVVPPAVPQAKILSRNGNGTIVWTSSPNNEAELQLYRVMQRASLLAYYDTLLEMGGDDVQQLCDAGEEEFLEIMALVGMASKPLHVRRLQKALQEWLTNPAMFRSPLVPGGGISPRPVAPTPSLVLSPLLVPPQPPSLLTKDTPPRPPPSTSPLLNDGSGGSPGGPPSSGGPSPGPPGSPLHQHPPPILLESQVGKLADAAQHLVNTLPQMEPKSHTAKKKMNKDLEQVLSMPEDDPRRMELIRKFAAIYGRFDCKRKPEKPLTLHEVSVNEAAAQICRFMPALLTRRDELFPLARQVVRDSGYHYSKGHSKSFAKGYNGDQPHSKRAKRDYSPEPEEAIRRRQERLDQIAEELRNVNERTQGLLDGKNKGSPVANSPPEEGVAVQTQVEALQSRQQALLNEQSQLVSQSLQPNRYRQNSCGKIYADSDKIDTDDTDSQLSFSNESSPLPEVGDSRDSMSRECDGASSDPTPPSPVLNKLSNNQGHGEKIRNHVREVKSEDVYGDPFFHENKVQVIASSGGNIIAVANPALSMSPAIIDHSRNNLIKSETITIDPKLA